MRFRMVVCVAVLLLVSPAVFPQSNRVSIYLTNPGVTSSDYLGTHYTGGGGLSLSHSMTPRFTMVIAAAAERDYSGYVAFNRDGSVREKYSVGYTTYPIDLLAQYQFRTDGRWKPYAGAGLRYANRPRMFMTGSELVPELNGGVMFTVTPRLGIVLDGRWSGTRHTSWNPMLKASAGLNWGF
ncbi:MAG TPA: hypothetical protein VLV78_00840 [Thermoanaerobaculia bacterium]|nr:hypothetical protein [Thermoanaerobaculia bacterium]